MEWVRNAVDRTGVRDISFTGGLALNIKANKRLAEMGEVDSIFVSPAAGDESLPIGASFLLLDELEGSGGAAIRDPEPFMHSYFGSSPGVEGTEALVEHPLIREHFEVIRDATPGDVAAVIQSGEICGLFHGAMEFGPRALGHRSLIADPSNPDSVKKINEAIKMRDFWMPFTPSILDERVADYIINPKGLACDFMTLAFDTTDLGKKHLLAAIHPADKTARPQRVRADISPTYYQIIKAFEDLTGIGAVLNTSLNIHGKPIVMEPHQIADEILTADGVDLNHLYVNGTLLRRHGVGPL